jgi:hypothetical protein
VTVPSARCSARARPIAARVHHRPPGARPGHNHDPDPAARKADELNWRAEPAASHRTHPPAVDVDPGACQPTTPWLPQPDSPAAAGSAAAAPRAVAAPPRSRPAVAPRRGGRRSPGQAWSGVPRPCSRRRDSRTASRPPPRPRRGSRIPAAAHRGLPASASMSALPTLAGTTCSRLRRRRTRRLRSIRSECVRRANTCANF